jgi:response regulator RpfG family c-di-GMP phosphodiesterase
MTPNPKVLFVDDDQNILSAYYRNLRKRYDIDMALGGEPGLASMEGNGPYTVVVADMQMPGMDGIAFLKRAQALAPDTVRIMLTGNADQRTAQDAVNQGHVFRFLTKPCTPEELALNLDAAIHQHRLVVAERELLEQTLAGTLKVLTEILATVDPVSFGMAVLAADLAEEAGRRMGLEETWSLRAAAMLGPIGLVTVPGPVLARHRAGEPLGPEEAELLRRVPEIGARLLGPIPRLEAVVEAIRWQEKNFNGSGFPLEEARGGDIPLRARILRAATDYVRLQARRSTPARALEQMRLQSGWYDPEVLAVLAGMVAEEDGAEEMPVRALLLADLRVGQVLAAPAETREGAVVLPRATRLSFTHLEKLQNFARLMGVREPLHVFDVQ